jgi:hypothetical protein
MHRKWIRLIAAAMSREVEIVSAPSALAQPTWPYARFPLTVGHHVLDTSKLTRLLPHQPVPVAYGVQRTVDWCRIPRAGRPLSQLKTRSATIWRIACTALDRARADVKQSTFRIRWRTPTLIRSGVRALSEVARCQDRSEPRGCGTSVRAGSRERVCRLRSGIRRQRFAGARIDRICRKADINVRMLYHFFGSSAVS